MRNLAKSAVVVVGMLAAWSSANAMLTYDLEVLTSTDLANGVVLQGVGESVTLLTNPGLAYIENPGTTVTGLTSEEVSAGDLYVFAAIYDGGMAVSFNDSTAEMIDGGGMSWSALFGEFAEEDVASALGVIYSGLGDVAAAEQYLADWYSAHTSYWTSLPTSSSMYLFSNPVGGGAVNWNVVPEPGTMLALGAGIAAFARRRRK